MMEWLGLPINASTHGAQVDQLILWMHWLMAALFLGWGAFFVYTLVRFRKKRQAQAMYEGTRSHLSTYTEVGIVVVELFLLIGVAIPVWSRKVEAFPPDDKAFHVRVVAEQFAWNIHYPGADGVFGRTDWKLINKENNPLGLDRSDQYALDDITTINHLHFPVHTPVIAHIASKDVIHSFSLPQMRVKQDAIPGIEIPIWFEATMATPEGERWEIACAQLCGLGHYRMRGFYVVQEQADYDAWMAEQVAEQLGTTAPAETAPADTTATPQS
jgi:cytochrome c oxidase subunit 2